MSKALDYLLRARPEAMGHYMQFLKLAGGTLDPKTRALISVITKVHAQTPRGFRQYLRRALRAGASPDEVLDALLMAFPALGLTKVVWAVDQILAMDLPEFALAGRESAQPGGEWQRLGALDSFPDGDLVALEHDGRPLLVVRRGDAVQVFDRRCPHQATLLPDRLDDDGMLSCVQHGWVFEPDGGRCVAGGEVPLRRIEARVVDGEVVARL